MATVSFTKEMKLNKKETENLFKILESKSKPSYKVNAPISREASAKDLDKLFGKKK